MTMVSLHVRTVHTSESKPNVTYASQAYFYFTHVIVEIRKKNTRFTKESNWEKEIEEYGENTEQKQEGGIKK